MQTSHQAPSLHCARREQQYTSEAPRLELFISVISLHRFMVISPFYSPMSQNVVEKWESLSDNISSSSCVYRQAERKNFFINTLVGLTSLTLSSSAHTRIGSIARPIIMQIQRHDRHESRSHLLRAANGCRLKSFCALGRFPSKAAAGLEFIRRQDGGGTSR